MFNRCSFCWMSACLVGALILLVPAGTARAQLGEWQGFGSTLDVPPHGIFAVAPNLVDYWSLDTECSAGYIVGGRGDGGDLHALQNQMPPSTGTRLVRDLTPGSGSSTFGQINHSYVDVVSHVFLSADNGSGNQELYRVLDVLYPAMVLKADINPGAAGSSPASITHQVPGVQGTLYFSADNGTNGRELWISQTATDDTTTEHMVMDIYPGASSSNPVGFGMTLTTDTAKKMVVFAADDGTNGRELWSSYVDATSAHVTALLMDIYAGASSSDPQSITTVTYNWGTNSKAFFTADDGVNGRELWVTDGTAANTAMLKNIAAGALSSNPANLTPAIILEADLTPSASALFFTVGNDLWWSKGALGGADTLLIKNVGGTPANLTVVYNTLLTGYTLYFTVGNVLWKSDGTAGGTVAVTTFPSAPANLTGARGVLYFAADDGTGSGVELWKNDGTTTSMVKDINPGAASSSPTNLIALGGGVNIRFSADDGTNGRELWKSNGTVDGTVMIKDINPGAGSSDPANMFLTGPGSLDSLFFTANDGEHGRELWQSDGYAEAGESHVGVGYKWDLESVIKNKYNASKIAVAATNTNVFIVGATFDMPIMGPLEDLMPAAHQVTHYIELTDGTDRAPLDISYVDCGDDGFLRPKAALTDDNNHKAIAFGMVAVLDQDPCDETPRGAAAPGAPFAYVPSIYDGHDWIPMDRAHILPGVTTDPPTASTLGQAPRTSNFLHTAGTLPSNLVAATSDPSSRKRYNWIRLEVWTDYIRAYWYSKNVGAVYVATIPRQYKGAFKALYTGSIRGVQSTVPIFFDSLSLGGGILTDSVDMHGACCTAVGCANVIGGPEVCAGTFSAWRVCGEPTTPLCCPIPWADYDRDGDVDMDDFAALQRCLTPSSIPIPTDCACFDKNADGAINVTDVNKFVTCAAGSNVTLTPAQITACDTLP